MAQNEQMQSGIRNTMLNQAQAQNQANLSQRQANRDWWFQYQGQKMAQDRAQASRVPMALASAAGFESSPAPAARPAASDDIIKWPSILQGPSFAEQRGRIEAPYLRSAKGLSTPTAKDYENMALVTGQMKVILKQMTSQITAQEYLEAEGFLDQLGAEARSFAAKAAPAP